MKNKSLMEPASRQKLRCAVYTRKSSEEGLEMEFNSLDAQRESCEAYVASQRAEGWILVADRYDDGGFSGGTLERPALKRLRADIEAGKIDVIVVYKIDRLSRSLMDFSRLVEVFDQHKVTFVSVTQSFNTTTSMGRLTLNVLLSFAQFEREVIGERIRDKFAASRKRGMWMGGWAPLGYEVRDRKLLVNEVDAKLVRSIFQRFLKIGSATTLARELIKENVRNKYGKLVDKGILYKMLKNPVYIGVAVHKGVSYPRRTRRDHRSEDLGQGSSPPPGKPTQASGCYTGTDAVPVERNHLRPHRCRHVANAHAEKRQALSLLSKPDSP
jgi:site-specific DNA recombinase